MTFGRDGYRYELVKDWAKLPEGWSFNDAAGVAVDSDDRVYVFSRSAHPVTVFDREGNLLRSWGEGVFASPHSLRFGPDGLLYLVDVDDHTVRRATVEGKVTLTLGTKNAPSDTGAVGRDYRTVKRVAGPFHGPTDVSFGRDGDILVTDGYGNARIHRFSGSGGLVESRGERGTGPGQYNLPHSICVGRDGRVYVADRENSRIQVFTPRGEFITEWRDVRRPTWISVDRDGTVYVTELGYLAGVYPGTEVPPGLDPAARITIRSADGELISEWGSREGCTPGNFFAPHTVAVDSKGDIYVGEVSATTKAPKGCHTLQKFVKQ